MDSILDERFTIEDLLDAAVLGEVLQAYGQCFRLGVTILGYHGEEILSQCPPNSLCEGVKSGSLSGKCAEVMNKIAKQPLEGSNVLQIKSFCGMRYSLFNLNHQLETVGRVIVGPFRDTQSSPEDILNAIGWEPGEQEAAMLAKVPALGQDELKKSIRLLAKILDAILFINAKRLMTTRIHLDAVFSEREKIFAEVEMAATAADREEIDRLKDLF